MKFIVKLLMTALAVLISAYLLPGVEVESFFSALLVAAFLALLNTLLRPVLVILTIPITFLTLGLFLLVINAVIVMMVDGVVDGFMVRNLGWAILFSLILSLVVSIFEQFNRKMEE